MLCLWQFYYGRCMLDIMHSPVSDNNITGAWGLLIMAGVSQLHDTPAEVRQHLVYSISHNTLMAMPDLWCHDAIAFTMCWLCIHIPQHYASIPLVMYPDLGETPSWLHNSGAPYPTIDLWCNTPCCSGLSAPGAVVAHSVPPCLSWCGQCSNVAV